MTKNIQSTKGMHDLHGDICIHWSNLESKLNKLADLYGYSEIRTPLLESSALFERSLGSETDVINKEMYSFIDKNQQHLSLRPEGTASRVRAGVQHGLLYNQIQKFWYLGPMFRREKPQKGRLRQFHQFGLEMFGSKELICEIELITFAQQLWQNLSIDSLCLEINTLGNSSDRAAYKKAIVDYFSNLKDDLTEEEQERLKNNPLRLLDSKSPNLKQLINNAPAMQDFYCQETADNFLELQARLNDLNIKFHHNRHLVRGLDYYNNIVFEWTSSELGAQGTVCAGGRYDGLVSQLSTNQTPAVGLAIGLERLLELCQPAQPTNNTIALINDTTNSIFDKISFNLRKQNPTAVKIITDTKQGNSKNQIKRAIKNNNFAALIISNDTQACFKFLQSKEQEISIPVNENLIQTLIKLVKGN